MTQDRDGNLIDWNELGRSGELREIASAFFELTRMRRGEMNPDDVPSEAIALWDEYRERLLSEAPIPPRAIRRIDEAMSGVNLVDPAIDEIRISKSDKITFILGAGASAPSPSSIPTVSQLLPELWRRAERIDQEELNRLRDWCQSNGVDNIEDLLTAAYLADFSSRKASLTGLLGYFLFGNAGSRRLGARQGRMPDPASVAHIQGTLTTLFGLLMGQMVEAPPNAGHLAVAELAKRHGALSIVTTNYDGCIDAALQQRGVEFGYGVENWPTATTTQAVSVVKVHGSVNWTFCDSCQEIRVFDLEHLRKDFTGDVTTYAVVGICRNCGAQRQPLIVPPLSMKLPMYAPLFSVWEQAREAFKGSDLIIAVGYSFADADAYLTRMLEVAMSESTTLKVVVVDKDPSVARKLQRRFGAHSQGFTSDRVLMCRESCELYLPRLTDQLAPQGVPTAVSTNGNEAVSAAPTPGSA